MLSLVWAQVVHRGSRSLALFLGLLVACAGFTVLTAQSRSQELVTRGKVTTAGRSAYDILVRPKGGQSALEKKDGLVQAGFLTQGHGGISLAQWHTIQKIQNVQVAAPVAVIGYVTPKVQVPVGAMTAATGPRSLFRLDATWTTDNGTSTEVSKPHFQYVTPKLEVAPDSSGYVARGADGKKHTLCEQTTAGAPWTVSSAVTVGCGASTAGKSITGVTFAYPFLVEAIDPVAEAKLAGLKSAMTTGSYLKSAPLKSRSFGESKSQVVPVIMASTPATHVSVKYKLVRLPASAADKFSNGAGTAGMSTLPGTVVATGTANQSSAYPRLLHDLPTRSTQGLYPARNLTYLYTTGGTSYTASGTGSGRLLRAHTKVNKQTVWANPGGGFVLGSPDPSRWR